jgi:hypothetical protein
MNMNIGHRHRDGHGHEKGHGHGQGHRHGQGHTVFEIKIVDVRYQVARYWVSLISKQPKMTLSCLVSYRHEKSFFQQYILQYRIKMQNVGCRRHIF